MRAADTPWLLPEATRGTSSCHPDISVCVLPVHRPLTEASIEGVLVEAVIQAHNQFMTRATTHGVYRRPTSTSSDTSFMTKSNPTAESSLDLLHSLYEYFSPFPPSSPQHSTDEFDLIPGSRNNSESPDHHKAQFTIVTALRIGAFIGIAFVFMRSKMRS